MPSVVHIPARRLRLGEGHKHKDCSWSFKISRIPNSGHFCDKEIRFAGLLISQF